MVRFMSKVPVIAFLYGIIVGVLCNGEYRNSRSNISKHHLSICYSGLYDLLSPNSYKNSLLPFTLRWNIGYEYFPFQKIGFSCFIMSCGTALWEVANKSAPYNSKTFVAFGVGCELGYLGDYGSVKSYEQLGSSIHLASCIHAVCNVNESSTGYSLGICFTPLKIVTYDGHVKRIFRARFGYVDLMELKSLNFDRVLRTPTLMNAGLDLGIQIDLGSGGKKHVKKLIMAS